MIVEFQSSSKLSPHANILKKTVKNVFTCRIRLYGAQSQTKNDISFYRMIAEDGLSMHYDGLTEN